MNFNVEMVRDSDEAGARDRFECGLALWDLFVELGKTFGWKPRGTTYLPKHPAQTLSTSNRHGYRPGDPRDYKQVDAEDANAWARALTMARASPHLSVMLAAHLAIEDRGESAAEPSQDSATAILDEFIEYAFGGAFAFAGAG